MSCHNVSSSNFRKHWLPQKELSETYKNIDQLHGSCLGTNGSYFVKWLWNMILILLLYFKKISSNPGSYNAEMVESNRFGSVIVHLTSSFYVVQRCNLMEKSISELCLETEAVNHIFANDSKQKAGCRPFWPMKNRKEILNEIF
jgi:hypothetical protein